MKQEIDQTSERVPFMLIALFALGIFVIILNLKEWLLQ